MATYRFSHTRLLQAVIAVSFFSTMLACSSLPRTDAPIQHAGVVASHDPVLTEVVTPFIEDFCQRCHGEKRQRADLNLITLASEGMQVSNDVTWETMEQMILGGQMPPSDRPQPDEEDLAPVIEWLDAELERVVLEYEPDPGRITARRLNRVEYDNTIHDLLGIEIKASKEFPVDDSGYGFDNIGDVLSMSPVLLEKYFVASERIAAEAIKHDSAVDPEVDARMIFVCGHPTGEHIDSCERKILNHLARRAYRRPASRRELKKLSKLFDEAIRQGDSFERGIELSLQALLLSPHFLFRIEQHRRPNDPESIQRVAPFELASRLSYFLWSSMPDEKLFELAAEGTLQDSETLAQEVSRMLSDPRADRFVDNFTGQWLELRNLPYKRPDRNQFPTFKRDLVRAMRDESQMFFETILQEDRSIIEFLDADYTFVNETLAEHYGIEGVEGDEMRRIEVDQSQRGGLVSHASFLTMTSRPTRTSPVLRGVWILENLLGIPPPPPPPDVPDLQVRTRKGEEPKSLREKLELHRADAACAGCHATMDPLGFGLENYDPIGAWRTHDKDILIDSTGALPHGGEFSGPGELKAILVTRSDEFVRCFTEKMLTYALGRGVERFDRPVLDDMCRTIEAEDYRFSSVIMAIVNSFAFQMRRGDGEKA